MKNTLKSMDLFQVMMEDLAREASVPLPSSQSSAISDSWFIDNNPLFAACEANADFEWKYRSDCVTDATKLENEIGNCSDSDSLCATDLVFSSSVAFTPPTSPNNYKMSGTTETETLKQSEAEIDECSVLIEEIFETSTNDKSDLSEQRRIEEIQNWLLMCSNSQGNEFLSSQESVTNDKKCQNQALVDKVDNVLFDAEAPNDSNVIIEADVSQVIVLPNAEEEEMSTRLRKKRQHHYSDEADVIIERPTKKRVSEKCHRKRDQNKEAAKRYRDRKKKESTLFRNECDDLRSRNEKARQEIADKLKEREVLLDLWLSLEKSKTNPNLKIIFPDWV